MRRSFILFVLFVLLFSAQPVQSAPGEVAFAPGAHLRFGHLTIEDGLSQNAGLALFQDSRGFLWIGTQDGLDRYDGYRITEYKHDPEDPDSISLNSVIELYEDAEGFLWVGTWGGGLNRMDPNSGKFTHYLPDPNDPASLSHLIVTSIYPAGPGQLWVGTLGGLDLLDLASGKFTHYRNDPTDPNSLSSNAIAAIAPADDGKLWIGTGAYNIPGAGLNLFDPANGKATHFAPAGNGCFQSANISDIISDARGMLWIGYGGYGVTGGGIDRYSSKDNQCVHFDNVSSVDGQITDNNVTDLMLDQDGALWASWWASGVWRMDPDRLGEFTEIRHNPADPDSLSNNNVFTLLQDHTGVIWVGTLSAGVNTLNLDTLQFRTYRNNAVEPNSLSSNHVSAFAETSNAIWVSTWETGLSKFDPSSGIFRGFRADPSDSDALSSDLVAVLYTDIDDTLWIGTMGGGLNHFDPKTEKFTTMRHEPGDPTSLPDNQVTGIVRDDQGRLWVGSIFGVSRLDPGATGFVHYPMNYPPVSFELKEQELWIGSWGGGVSMLDLAQPANLNPATASFIQFKHDPSDSKSLSEDSVWVIHADSRGYLWFGTQGGLNRYDPRTGEFISYTEKDGLPNAAILGIVEDEEGIFWITTNNRLARFDPLSEAFSVYDKNDGLQSNEFNSNAYYRSPRTGDIYVGGVNGFSIFNPRDLVESDTPPQVAITSFSVFNTAQAFDPTGKTPVELKHTQNFISFEFAALDFHNPTSNIYQYKLEGFDKNWIDSGERNYASYTNLPGGQYTFRVKAANSEGVWSAAEATLPLVVTPPFWQFWQFQFGAVLAVGSLIAAGFHWRIREVREQNSRLQAMVEEQKHVESELRQSEERFRAIFENSGAGIGLMSLERVVLDANPAMTTMLGYSHEELVGCSPAMVTYPEDYGMATEHFQQLVAGEINHFVDERRYVRKNGEVFWVQISMSMVRGPEGEPQYLIGLLSDINAQKQAQDQLATQEKEYRRLLEQRIAERTEELNLANERLREKAAQDAVLAERTRLARDLHDAVTQTLFSATLIADVLPDIWELNHEEGKRRLDEVRQLTRGALAEMRTLLVELRPNALIEAPLPVLLRQLTDALTGRARIHIQLDAEGSAKLPPEVQISLYRIAQEALNNVVKHARATQAIVTLRLGDHVRLSITDNGAGFEPSSITADHLGLKIMRERVETIGAHLSIYSEPGEGTQISVNWEAHPTVQE